MTEPIPSSPDNRSTKPPGVLPKNLHAWVIAGIALVMMLIIGFSGTNAPKPRAAVPIPGAAVAEPNAARIQEYRERIEEQLKRLAQEQARLSQEQGAPNVPAAGVVGFGPSTPLATLPTSRGYESSAPATERSWIELDRQKRQYESRYASSVALTRRQLANSEGSAFLAGTALHPLADARAQASAQPPVNPSSGKTDRILEGTIIETVLTNRLDGTFSGPVNCLVTTPVYSEDRRRVLIPRGSRVLGSVRPVESFGQQRLAVSFHRLIRPDKTSVALESPPGLSQVGETGLLDKVNRHYGQIFGVSLAIGAIAGLSQVNTAAGVNASSADLYRQGVAGSLSQTSLNILDRYLNVLPTFTIREGHRIKVYLTGDLEIPAAPQTPQKSPEGGQS